jgi:serine/threonine protein kinase
VVDPEASAGLLPALQQADAEVIRCANPVDALAVLNRQEVAVVLTDYLLPGISGIELLILVHEKWPRIRSIMMTASTDIRVAADAINRSLISFFILKPCPSEDLAHMVGAALRAWQIWPGAPECREPAAAGESATSPRQLGPYRLEELIATGGMAELYRARILGPGGFEKDVAVKRILPQLSRDRAFLEMFQDEAMIMVTLSHGNVVTVLDYGQACGEHYLVMEYVRGLDLRQLLDPPGPLPVDAACFVAHQVALGLDYVHRKADDQGQPLKIVHRDISPKNLLISLEGAVKITDFGIARAARRISNTVAGGVKGTLSYMSPEQITGEPVDSRTDIYALGVVLYEMLTGVNPFEAGTHQESVARITKGSYEKPHVLNRQIPRRLSEVIAKALKAKANRRHQRAGELAADLEDLLHEQGLRPDANALVSLIRQRLP